MADRDNYRGYGSPSGRYYENREYEPGDRSRRDRDERSWFGGGRDDDRMRGRDDWRGGRDHDDDRGFFERAGEQVRSWFSDDDDHGSDRDRYLRQTGDRDQLRRQGQDRGFSSGGMMSSRGGLSRDRDDRPPQTFGAEYTSGGYDYGRDQWRGRNRDRGGSYPHDDHYSEWRRQQMDALDRDYDEYRRENRDKFHSEFSNWRGQRQQQRSSMRQVREQMEVLGSDGQTIGTVDKVTGDRIILAKSGAMAGGHRHSIPCSWIQSVDDKVTINKSAEQARDQWRDEENRRALFESEDQRSDDGPHILDRSFSGTYDKG